LTQSRKLKDGDGPLNPQKLADVAQKAERNYILCHVRRVVGKKEDEDISDVEKTGQ
jgi:hypothetical protein